MAIIKGQNHKCVFVAYGDMAEELICFSCGTKKNRPKNLIISGDRAQVLEDIKKAHEVGLVSNSRGVVL